MIYLECSPDSRFQLSRLRRAPDEKLIERFCHSDNFLGREQDSDFPSAQLLEGHSVMPGSQHQKREVVNVLAVDLLVGFIPVRARCGGGGQ